MFNRLTVIVQNHNGFVNSQNDNSPFFILKSRVADTLSIALLKDHHSKTIDAEDVYIMVCIKNTINLTTIALLHWRYHDAIIPLSDGIQIV